MNNVRFINHASYIIETNKSILLVDPWVEGYAFDKGWALLDSTTSNDQLLDFLSNIDKNICIWISHEHSDHFSVPFIMGLKKRKLNVKFFFQKTLDGRVADFISKQGFAVIESTDKLEKIDSELSLVTFPFTGGDSYSLMLVNGYCILNINDCFISNKATAEQVANSYKKYTDKIDLLFTQFGYANWFGNESEVELRTEKSLHTLSNIKLQVETFAPKNVVPFASFIYFCHQENFYMNDAQNSPRDVDTFFKSKHLSADLIVLKPWDTYNLKANFEDHTEEKQSENIEYWENLILSSSKHETLDAEYTEIDIYSEYAEYRKKVLKSFFFLPALFERLGLLSKLKIFIKDLNIAFQFSYISGMNKINGDKRTADIAVTSSTLMFILKNEYGADTTQVNAKFERVSDKGDSVFIRHFSVQHYLKNGFGVKHPIVSTKILVGILIEKFLK